MMSLFADPTAIGQFLREIAPSRDGFIVISLAHRDRDNRDKNQKWAALRLGSGRYLRRYNMFFSTFWKRELVPTIVSDLSRLNQAGWNVYFSVAQFKDPKRGRKIDNLAHIQTLYADFDLENEITKAFNRGCGWGVVPAPSIQVCTSAGHFQYFWLFSAPLSFKLARDTQFALPLLLNGMDAAAKDVARVMRLPGFLNQKEGRENYLVTQQRLSDERFSSVLCEQIVSNAALVAKKNIAEVLSLPPVRFTSALTPDCSNSFISVSPFMLNEATARWQKAVSRSGGDKRAGDMAAGCYLLAATELKKQRTLSEKELDELKSVVILFWKMRHRAGKEDNYFFDLWDYCFTEYRRNCDGRYYRNNRNVEELGI